MTAYISTEYRSVYSCRFHKFSFLPGRSFNTPVYIPFWKFRPLNPPPFWKHYLPDISRPVSFPPSFAWFERPCDDENNMWTKRKWNPCPSVPRAAGDGCRAMEPYETSRVPNLLWKGDKNNQISTSTNGHSRRKIPFVLLSRGRHRENGSCEKSPLFVGYRIWSRFSRRFSHSHGAIRFALVLMRRAFGVGRARAVIFGGHFEMQWSFSRLETL